MCGPGTSLPGEWCALLRGNGSSQISLCLLALWRKKMIFLSFIYFLGTRQIFLIPLASRCLQVFPMVLLWKGQIPWHNRLCSQGLPNPCSLDPCCCLGSPLARWGDCTPPPTYPVPPHLAPHLPPQDVWKHKEDPPGPALYWLWSPWRLGTGWRYRHPGEQFLTSNLQDNSPSRYLGDYRWDAFPLTLKTFRSKRSSKPKTFLENTMFSVY